MKVLILAGGYGTRLYPLITDTPKALLEVAGKTLIDHALDKYVEIKGVEEVLVVTNAKFADQIGSWAAERKGCPFPVRVINDGTHTPEERLGAIGDVLFTLDRVPGKADWAVIGSDNLFNEGLASFLEAARRNIPAVTIGCYDIGDTSGATKYGVVEIDARGKVLSLEEKPKEPRSSLISMCLYYFPGASLGRMRTFVQETGRTDTTGGYIQWLFSREDVFAHRFGGKWYDIGSLESYQEAQKQFLSK
ncbi:MAG: nucleotidyltransferase family protein [Elusimicrobia bacterium]|nr:nucleotidyltransferase family protein [Elusimicrobiota bacterium]